MSGLALLVAVAFAGETPLVAPMAPEESVSDNLFLVHVGARSLDDDIFYDPVEDVGTVGFEYVRNLTGQSTVGLGLEFGLFLAGETDDSLGADVTAAFVEGSIGLRGRLDAGPVQLFAGAGPTYILAAIDIEDGPNEDDSSGGIYAHAGVLFRIGDSLRLGLDARRVSGTEISFEGFVDTDADYSQVTVAIGWGS